jgi:MFS family permease
LHDVDVASGMLCLHKFGVVSFRIFNVAADKLGLYSVLPLFFHEYKVNLQHRNSVFACSPPLFHQVLIWYLIEHFDVEDRLIGTLSSSIFMGMMFGALFWGTFSDSHGRKLPFNMTLAITALFGIAASFAPTFWSLCLFLFFLGFGVGGNMPTDGKIPSHTSAVAFIMRFLI